MAITLLDKISRLEEEGPIDVASVDFTVNNPDLVGGEMGQALLYSEAVESEVPTTANVIRTILPNMTDELHRFVDIWDIQEAQHGVLLTAPRQACGLESLPTRQSVPTVMKFVGGLTRLSPGIHEAVEMIYHTEAAMGEKETLLFYKGLKDKLREAGEQAMAEMVGRIASQEAAHLSFYTQAARQQRGRLRPWQLGFARMFVEATYTPVGVRTSRIDRDRRLQFGHAAFQFTGDNVRAVTDPVERLAGELLRVSGQTVHPFLFRRYVKYIREYQESIAA